jgi:putative hydrolase of the HAD superfamily
MKTGVPTCLFLDIGGVLLTDGWQTDSRKLASDYFKLEWDEMELRHHLNFDTYEEGKMSIEEYLGRVVFYKDRAFTLSQFKDFMFERSKPCDEMIQLFQRLKLKYKLKIVAVSNEARELNDYRIHHFKLNQFIDCFVSSCFVNLRKPDQDIFKFALDIAQVPLNEIIYVENTAMFIEVANKMGIQGILHTDYQTTRKKIASFGLLDQESANHADARL